MQLNQLTNEEVSRLEKDSFPVENLVNGILFEKNDPYLMMKIQRWYKSHGLSASKSQKRAWAKLIEIFGCHPNYYVTYEYENAVWGFDWNGNKFILYKDERGLKIQVEPKFRKSLLYEFLIEIKNMLVNPNYIDPFYE